MGVTGLWKLVDPCGNRMPIETLEGKILAVDISIWLHQVVKGFQDSKGSLLPHAHLLGLFHRLCKLLYYRVRPVFVFDGCVPQLKRDTIARRYQQRSKLNNEADRIQTLLLQSLVKEKVVQQALGIKTQLLIQSPSKRQRGANKDDNEKNDLFKLPNVPLENETLGEDEDNDASTPSSLFETSTSVEYSSCGESNPWREYNTNLQAIDVRSAHFKSLPPEVRHEILVDIKETRKQSSWGRLHELPSCSDDFSSFQMKRLLKRRAVQESIEETEKEMGERAITFTDLKNFFTEEGIVDAENANQNTKPVCSDEATRFTLVRDLKKILANNKNLAGIFVEDASLNLEHMEELNVFDSPTVPNEQGNGNELTNSKDQIIMPKGDSDTDIGNAIALSKEDDTVHVYALEDYEYESNENLRLNRQQRNQLKNTAIGPARAFMIEYGGMNDEEVERIMDKTQADNYNDTDDLDIAEATAVSLEDGQCAKKDPGEMKSVVIEACDKPHVDISQEICLRVSDGSETDSDLEVVADVTYTTPITQSKNNIEVIIKTQVQLESEDNLFSDIFEASLQATAGIDAGDSKYPKEYAQGNILNTSQTELSEGGSGEEHNKKAMENHEDTHKDKTKLTFNVEYINGNIKKARYIMDELKKQADDVKSISLDDVGICESDDKCKAKSEIIEICDSDDEEWKQEKTPIKSPMFRTPSKNKGINEYFDTKYVVKRTPENNVNEAKQSPYVKSPFFVKKSPTSHRKGPIGKNNISSVHGHKHSQVSKSLFESTSTSPEKELESIKQDDAHLKPQDIMKNAGSDLKEQNTTEQLQLLASGLAKERYDLESARNRQERMGTAINQNMHTECQELLKLFGIPYILAPMEAEAQCAFLESINLTHGTITDDSDIWLFGGRTVYKNFFEQNKNVLKFEADKISHTYNCDREKLIQLACLVGSDYTTGIHGIGTVTALEILAAFSDTSKMTKEDSTINNVAIGNVLSVLWRFRDWLKGNNDLPQHSSSAHLKLRKKLKNIELDDGFPNPAVIEAYLSPKVDDSKAPFRWGYPDVESIQAFTKKVFGWTTNKTGTVLNPVLKRISDRQTQASIRQYFTTKSALRLRELKVSKRVQKAIDTLGGTSDTIEPEAIVTKRTKRSRRIEKQKEIYITQQKLEPDLIDSHVMISPMTDVASASTAVLARESNKCIPILPITKEFIPQRERYNEKKHKRKENAVAL